MIVLNRYAAMEKSVLMSSVTVLLIAVRTADTYAETAGLMRASRVTSLFQALLQLVCIVSRFSRRYVEMVFVSRVNSVTLQMEYLVTLSVR